MKNIIKITLVALVFIFLRCKPLEVNTIDTFVEPYKFNLIGITGKPSDTAYVEVWYSEKDKEGKNKLVHKWVKPPVFIGGHFTNVTYDSIHSNWARFDKRRGAKIDYSKGGSHYMRIKNHSNKPIEYFIAGTQQFRTRSYNGKSNIVDVAPNVLYKNIPIYYMLFPNEAPSYDVYTCLSALCNDVKKVPLTISKTYTIESMMQLYRSEFDDANTNSFHYRHRKIWKIPSKKGWDISIPSGSPYQKAKIYGKVMPKQAITSSNKNIFINHSSGDSYSDIPINRNRTP